MVLAVVFLKRWGYTLLSIFDLTAIDLTALLIPKLHAAAPPSYQGDSFISIFEIDVEGYNNLSIESIKLYGQSSSSMSISGDISGELYSSKTNVTLSNQTFNVIDDTKITVTASGWRNDTNPQTTASITLINIKVS